MTWLYRQVSTPTAVSWAKTLIFVAIASRDWLWDSIPIMQNSITLVLAALHFEIALTYTAITSCMMRPDMACQWRFNGGLTRICKKYKQWAGGWSILDILQRNANLSNFYIMPIRVMSHVFGLMWRCSRFDLSCSHSQCTCPKPSLHPFNYAGYVSSVQDVSLVTLALALTYYQNNF